MKSEQIKEITDRAAEQLVAALRADHSDALTVYPDDRWLPSGLRVRHQPDRWERTPSDRPRSR